MFEKVKIKRIKRDVWLILAIAAIILIITTFPATPADPDGALVMYNIIYFVLLGSLLGVLSVILMVVSVRKLALKKSKNEAIQVIILILSLPGFLFLSAMLMLALSDKYSDEYHPQENHINLQQYNGSDSVEVADKIITEFE